MIFTRIGYDRNDWQALEAALRALIAVADAEEVFGCPQRRFEVAGLLRGPAGEVWVKTVWIVETGTHIPRFISAYPTRRP